MVYFRTDLQLVAVFNYLRQALPQYKTATDSPFVQLSSSVAPLTEKTINDRDDISLYVTTSKMLLGVSVPGISVVCFLRPMNMLHYILQGGGRGGRKSGRTDGLREKVVVYVLWNNSDIANNVQGESVSRMVGWGGVGWGGVLVWFGLGCLECRSFLLQHCSCV